MANRTRLVEQRRLLAALIERQRVACELHDSVVQALYGIVLGVRTAQATVTRDPQRAADSLEYVLQLADAGLAEMRALMFELRPQLLADEGLIRALERQAEALQRRRGLDVELALGEEPDVSLAHKEALYRVAQVAVQNVIDHARATVVELRLAQQGGALELLIRDDGIGYSTAQVPTRCGGLRNIRQRVAALGGNLTVTSAAGQGTLVHCTLPATRDGA
jgi:signal transduction histidine kinase